MRLLHSPHKTSFSARPLITKQASALPPGTFADESIFFFACAAPRPRSQRSRELSARRVLTFPPLSVTSEVKSPASAIFLALLLPAAHSLNGLPATSMARYRPSGSPAGSTSEARLELFPDAMPNPRSAARWPRGWWPTTASMVSNARRAMSATDRVVSWT